MRIAIGFDVLGAERDGAVPYTLRCTITGRLRTRQRLSLSARERDELARVIVSAAMAQVFRPEPGRD